MWKLLRIPDNHPEYHIPFHYVTFHAKECLRKCQQRVLFFSVPINRKHLTILQSLKWNLLQFKVTHDPPFHLNILAQAL